MNAVSPAAEIVAYYWRKEEVQTSKFYFRAQYYILEQVSTNFLSQGPNNKYLRLFTPVFLGFVGHIPSVVLLPLSL